jgi:hypothetical protein
MDFSVIHQKEAEESNIPWLQSGIPPGIEVEFSVNV